MGIKGSVAPVYDFYENDIHVAKGTLEEIADKLKTSSIAIYRRHMRTKHGENKNVKYELVKIQNSKLSYSMFIEGKFIGYGTIEELSNISNFSKPYLYKISNGNYKSKIIEIY
ncbi:hypothetical protein mgb1_018 [Bacillus phage MG-B1]|uniref:Uncharacterized protein n=1 Tax=Bacillus phage MG-B1 TaxID=1309583 RepID=M4W8C3_9CAUD|nr:host nuclease inhibitor [Bacillus phage MG-B1]AGI10607.1 hypothetical protein mgb1_018 [Bacillus phage MG-B1]